MSLRNGSTSALSQNAPIPETRDARPLALDPSPARKKRLSVVLPILCDAFDDATEFRRDEWDFSTSARELFAVGVCGADLRWLIAHGLLAHKTTSRRRRTEYHPLIPGTELVLTGRSRFVLTEPGRQFASAFDGLEPEAAQRDVQGYESTPLPHWDAAMRQLSWRGRLVKRFRTPADNQERILAVFEEEQWPPRIDDPLGGGGSLDPVERLHDAIRRLNGHQLDGRIHFSRDGTGKGICWRGGEPPLARH